MDPNDDDWNQQDFATMQQEKQRKGWEGQQPDRWLVETYTAQRG